MLQQTQVERVVTPYQRFVSAFPTPFACAAGGAGASVRLWAGLGYNRRALNLHRAATSIVADHGGAVPRDDKGLRSLAGIGDYTSRAVRALAFGEDVAAVDTNVVRILTRCVAGAPLTARQATGLGDLLVPRGASWSFNQAMFDLGATVCTARRPRCDGCPLRRQCAWRRQVRAGERSGEPIPPDPWRSGSAARAQRAFAGSDRQGRGRLLDALRSGDVPRGGLAAACGWPGDRQRAERVAAALVGEGFSRWSGADHAVLRLC